MTNIKAAIRDPKTGKIFTGESHAGIVDNIRDGKDQSLARRMLKLYVLEGRTPASTNVGFLVEGQMYSRGESLKRWGVYYSQDINRITR